MKSNKKFTGVTFAMLGIMTGCSTPNYPPRDASVISNINEQMKSMATPKAKAAVLPDQVSASLLPPPRPIIPKFSEKQLQQRFDLVVTEAPINTVLMGIVEGTRYSILLRPKTSFPSLPGGAVASPPAPANDRVTLNLKNITVFEALDAIREVYGYDYTLEGYRIYVQPPELQTRLYQVDYIIGERRGVSDLQVIGGATIGSSSSSSSASASGTSGSSGTTSSSYSSVQASALSTIAKSDVWGEVEDSLRTALGCQIPKNLQSTSRTGSSTGAQTGTGTGASSTSGRASRADVSFSGETPTGERVRGVDGCTDGRAMSISQMSGTILVRGMPHEHRLIDKMLKSLQLGIQRQVIIEAKVIDVTLNAESQQGINWSNFNYGLHRASLGSNTTSITVNQPSGGNATGGAIAATTTLGTALGTAVVANAAGTAFSAGLGLALQFRNFAALINFLQSQGEVHVLSSPRISTLNSQKAVIKVGTEEPFVSSITPATTTTAAALGALTTSANLNYQPFFSGISLDVTPKVDDRGDITLHVHALVNNVVEKEKIAAPVADSVRVPFAINTINETDSVVKAKDGQVVVIGGLMTESASDNRGKIPGIGDVPGAGALFSKGAQKTVKRELVILLRPSVVRDEGIWEEDIAATQGRIEVLGNARNKPADASIK